jgi:hypothetical protein
MKNQPKALVLLGGDAYIRTLITFFSICDSRLHLLPRFHALAGFYLEPADLVFVMSVIAAITLNSL